MSRWPLGLSQARILLTNDDGFDAPGLAVLAAMMREISPDVWITAPEIEQSGAGHSLTLRRPLRIRERGAQSWSIDGTPTDCVLLAINRIMAECKPDLIISGINRGANLGEDVTYSGTVAAAFEATILGTPAIALSQELNPDGETDWRVPQAHLAALLTRLTVSGWPDNTLININFPPVAPERVIGVEATRQGRRKIGDQITRSLDPHGEPYYWIGGIERSEIVHGGTDVDAVRRGAISVTPIRLDFTDDDALNSLGQTLGGQMLGGPAGVSGQG